MTNDPKDPKNDAKENAWRKSIAKVEQAGVSPSIARALLQLNPNMREQGFTTAGLVAESQTASAQKPSAQAAQSPQSSPKAAANGGVFDVLAATSTRVTAEQRRVADAIVKLEHEQKALKAAELKAFETWLRDNDPDLRSPVTQDALARHKALLDALGFSVKSYIDRHRLKK